MHACNSALGGLPFLECHSRRCAQSGTPMTTSPRPFHRDASMVAPQPLLPRVFPVGLARGIQSQPVSCQPVFKPVNNSLWSSKSRWSRLLRFWSINTLGYSSRLTALQLTL